jgi:hypothetical protein
LESSYCAGEKEKWLRVARITLAAILSHNSPIHFEKNSLPKTKRPEGLERANNFIEKTFGTICLRLLI